MSESCSVMSVSLRPHGILQARKLEWVAIHFSRIFPTQRSNTGLPHCRWILYQLSHQGNPRILEWVACSSPEHIFLTQELNWGLWHCRQILYELSYQGIPSPMKFNLILLLCFLFPFNPLYFNFLNVNGLYF